jgi:RNA polymerase-associated protein LEO1
MKSQGLTYLVAQHKHSGVLQSEALVTGYMTLTPTGMQSETHRMLVRAVGQKHHKVARLRMAPDPVIDPEREKLELMKQSARKSKKRADVDDGLGGGRRKRAGSARKSRAAQDVWSDDGDEERHELGTDDEDEDGLGSSKGSPPKKRRAGAEESKKGAGEYQEDEFLVPDSSDEDAGSHEDHGKKRKHADEGVVEEDLLDKLETQIEEQERRQQKRPGETSQDADVDTEQHEMDVESEEDEAEDFKIRRAGGTSGRKKRAIDFDNDEDE